VPSSATYEPAALAHHRLYLGRRHGPGEIVALHLVAGVQREEIELRFGLDALGHDLQPEAVCEADDGQRDRRVVRMATMSRMKARSIWSASSGKR